MALRLRGWSIRFFPRDVWVGLFIGEKEPAEDPVWRRTLYVCPLPMLVISVDLERDPR